MTHPVLASLGQSEFDEFLFASIGEDWNGMRLSVLSALARSDVDPWQEASKLARLPGDRATERLASLIAALPDGPSARLDAGTIAARLVALLPHRVGANLPLRKTLLGAGDATGSRATMHLIFIVMAVMLGTLCFLASRQPPAPTHPLAQQSQAGAVAQPRLGPASPQPKALSDN